MRSIWLLLAFLILPQFTYASNESLISEIAEKAMAAETDSLVILENGKVIYENYFGETDHIRNVQSITKSVTGLALGILLDEGKLKSFDLPMSTWIPEWKNDLQKSKITLRMMMNHTSGYPDTEVDEEFFKRDDLVSSAIPIALTAEPGSRFLYSNIGTTLLQTVVAQVSGQSVDSYATEKIFKPLGISEHFWKLDKAGHERIAGGLSLSTAGLVQLGQLMLANGTYQGQQIISAETLKILLTKSQSYSNYGLLFWLEHAFGNKNPEAWQLFECVGYGGQFVITYPAKNLIIVRTKDPYKLVDEKLQQQAFGELRDLASKWQ